MHTLFCKTFDCLNFLKEHNTFIDLPKIIYFKAHKQREYDRI